MRKYLTREFGEALLTMMCALTLPILVIVATTI